MISCFRIAEVAVVVENCYRDGRDCKSEVLLREYALRMRQICGRSCLARRNGIIGTIPYVAMPGQSVRLSEANVPDEMGKTDSI